MEKNPALRPFICWVIVNGGISFRWVLAVSDFSKKHFMKTVIVHEVLYRMDDVDMEVADEN